MIDYGCHQSKRIIELDELPKLNGQEYVLIDNGETTYKVTVDCLLGYIAQQCSLGELPEIIFQSTSIIRIPEGEDIPKPLRKTGSYYLRVCGTKDASINIGLPSTIYVSPGMGLEIIEPV